MEFFAEYPILKWSLIGFGVLALLSKYLKFDPIDNLIDRIKKTYKFEEINHLNDEKLKQLVEDFNKQQFDQVSHYFAQSKDSYISFGFRALGQYADTEILDGWIAKEPNNALPKIIKSYQLVFKGWEARGRQTIDAVSKKNLATYKSCLEQAKTLLLSVQNESEFKVNVHALLLKIYKAVDTSRETIHQTYLEVEKENSNHAELNFNYFSAISLKWGGTEEEVNKYMASLSDKSEFISNLILAQYYFDFVHIMDGEDSDQEIKAFIERMRFYSVADNELYKFEFYLILYWLSNNLNYTILESDYKKLVHPFWRD